MAEVMLSNSDIERALGGKCIVIRYQDLYNFHTIGDLLTAGQGSAVILYETSDNIGHWTCVVRGTGPQDGIIFYFDSFGLPIDDPLAEIDPKFRVKKWEDYMYLSLLLAESPPFVEIDYSDKPLQEDRRGINTCGRWVLARCMMPHLDSDEFAELFAPIPGEKISPDDIIVEYTNQFL